MGKTIGCVKVIVTFIMLSAVYAAVITIAWILSLVAIPDSQRI